MPPARRRGTTPSSSGATESSANADDITVQHPGADAITPRAMAQTVRHNGGWMYFVRGGHAVNISARADGNTEHAERVSLWVYVDGREAADGAIRLTIANHRAAANPVASVQADSLAFTKNEGDTATFQIELNTAATRDLDVDVEVSSTEGPQGYPKFERGDLGTRTVRVRQGQTIGTLTVRSLPDDVMSEPADAARYHTSVSVSILGGEGYTVGTNATGKARIRDILDAAAKFRRYKQHKMNQLEPISAAVFNP